MQKPNYTVYKYYIKPGIAALRKFIYIEPYLSPIMLAACSLSYS
jgi:hypothetical protein